MSNPYYNRTFDVLPGSTNLSGTVEDEFDFVEDGFDAIDESLTLQIDDILAQLALKAPIASPAFTGAPTAPTPDVSDDSTRLATTAFVQDVLGAGGALLPPQAGHAGEFLTTDGVSVSWEPVSAATAWADITGKPTTIAGFGILNAQHAIEWARDGHAVATQPVRIDLRGLQVSKRGEALVIEARLPHQLLIAQGII